MINVWEHVNPEAEAGQFCQVHNVSFPVLLDTTGEYPRQVGVRGVPYNIFVDEQGVVRALGGTTPDEMQQALMTLFGADPSQVAEAME